MAALFGHVWDTGDLGRNLRGGSGLLPEALAAQPRRHRPPRHPRRRGPAGRRRACACATPARTARARSARARRSSPRPAPLVPELLGELPVRRRSALALVRMRPMVVVSCCRRDRADAVGRPLLRPDAGQALQHALQPRQLPARRTGLPKRGQRAHGLRRRRPAGGATSTAATTSCATTSWPTSTPIFPQMRGRIAETMVSRWQHAGPYAAPGRWRAQAALERGLADRIFFAGDWVSDFVSMETRRADRGRRGGERAARAGRGRGGGLVPRACVIVLDAVGAASCPTPPDYGDAGVVDARRTSPRRWAGCDLPHLQALGLGNVMPLARLPAAPTRPVGRGAAAERSAGKDTTIGHWELTGIVTPRAHADVPERLPAEVLDAFSQATGRGVHRQRAGLGHRDHPATRRRARQRTGDWIVYTSADSVFQVAAHEDVVPLEELYAACRTAREHAHRRARRRARHRPAVRRREPAPTRARPTATTSRSRRRAPTTSTRLREAGHARARRRQDRRHLRRPRRRRPRRRRARTPRASRRSCACWARSTTGSSSPTWSRPT